MTSTYVESTAIVKVTFAGVTSSGYISVPGIQVGDILIAVGQVGNAVGATAFAMVADTADSILQIDNEDLSARTFLGVVLRLN